MSDPVYCTITHVSNILSTDGVTYRVDDGTALDLYAAVIDEASSIIDEYALRFYTSTSMAASRWLTYHCANIAAWLLCTRRGNAPPSGIEMRYEKAMEDLDRVSEGKKQIPGAGQRRTLAPCMSNVRIRLDPFPRTVVEPNRSSRQRPTDYKQWADRFDFLDYSL